MKKFDLAKLGKTAYEKAAKHSPEILVGVGLVGMFTTVVMAVKATPKALTLMEEKKKEQHVEKLTAAETVKTTWKCYIPAAVTGALSTACIIGASYVDAKRNAALATAYTSSVMALKEYQEKVIENVGEKKEQAIRDAIAKDKVENDPVSNHEVIITGKGDTLCYDAHGGRYFKSDIEKIRRAINELNRRMICEQYISLNEFYYELGLKSTKGGDTLGWNLDGGLIEVHFSSQLSEDGDPCLVIDYSVAPRYGFDKLM